MATPIRAAPVAELPTDDEAEPMTCSQQFHLQTTTSLFEKLEEANKRKDVEIGRLTVERDNARERVLELEDALRCTTDAQPVRDTEAWPSASCADAGGASMSGGVRCQDQKVPAQLSAGRALALRPHEEGAAGISTDELQAELEKAHARILELLAENDRLRKEVAGPSGQERRTGSAAAPARDETDSLDLLDSDTASEGEDRMTDNSAGAGISPSSGAVASGLPVAGGGGSKGALEAAQRVVWDAPRVRGMSGVVGSITALQSDQVTQLPWGTEYLAKVTTEFVGTTNFAKLSCRRLFKFFQQLAQLLDASIRAGGAEVAAAAAVAEFARNMLDRVSAATPLLFCLSGQAMAVRLNSIKDDKQPKGWCYTKACEDKMLKAFQRVAALQRRKDVKEWADLKEGTEAGNAFTMELVAAFCAVTDKEKELLDGARALAMVWALGVKGGGGLEIKYNLKTQELFVGRIVALA